MPRERWLVDRDGYVRVQAVGETARPDAVTLHERTYRFREVVEDIELYEEDE